MVVSEVKFKFLTSHEKIGREKQLAEKWSSSSASRKYSRAVFEVIDASVLKIRNQ